MCETSYYNYFDVDLGNENVLMLIISFQTTFTRTRRYAEETNGKPPNTANERVRNFI